MVYDRAGKGEKTIKGVEISTPNKPKKTDSRYKREKIREKFRKRAGIEAVISHLKNSCGMGKNYYWSWEGAKINALLAGTTWNLRKYMKKLRREASQFLFFDPKMRSFFLMLFKEGLFTH